MVRLIDARSPTQVVVSATLYRDYPGILLDEIEAQWQVARDQAANLGQMQGLAPLEHAHWDWRNKTESVQTGRNMLIAIEYEDEVQGLMAVLRTPRFGLLGNGPVVYVDYVESAPWNLRMFVGAPRFLGVGSTLIADAVRLSVESGLDGRVDYIHYRRRRHFTVGVE
jgi:hypothetical protein